MWRRSYAADIVSSGPLAAEHLYITRCPSPLCQRKLHLVVGVVVGRSQCRSDLTNCGNVSLSRSLRPSSPPWVDLTRSRTARRYQVRSARVRCFQVLATHSRLRSWGEQRVTRSRLAPALSTGRCGWGLAARFMVRSSAWTPCWGRGADLARRALTARQSTEVL